MTKPAGSLQYKLELTDALMQFQFIEETLKMYIQASYWIIRKKTGDAIPIRLSRADIETEPLSGLLRHFSKYNSNNHLIAELKALIKDRNYCAHQAFLHTLNKSVDSEHMRKQINRIKEINKTTAGCQEAVFKELHQIDETVKSLGGPSDFSEMG